VVDWLKLLLRIQVTASNVGPETGYPGFLRGFSQFLQTNSGLMP